MPTYEYGCPSGHQFEKFYRKISDASGEVPCPVCAQIATRKLSGGAGLLFRGSGFYITDYGKDGKKGTTPARSAEGGGESKEGEGSPGAPPASKPDVPAAASTEPTPSKGKPGKGTPRKATPKEE